MATCILFSSLSPGESERESLNRLVYLHNNRPLSQHLIPRPNRQEYPPRSRIHNRQLSHHHSRHRNRHPCSRQCSRQVNPLTFQRDDLHHNPLLNHHDNLLHDQRASLLLDQLVNRLLGQQDNLVTNQPVSLLESRHRSHHPNRHRNCRLNHPCSRQRSQHLYQLRSHQVNHHCNLSSTTFICRTYVQNNIFLA
jgi:hypothetical protein